MRIADPPRAARGSTGVPNLQKMSWDPLPPDNQEGAMIEHFILPDERPLLRLPRSVVEQLINRKARLPQYAGGKVRCAQVLLCLDSASGGLLHLQFRRT